MEDQTSQSLTPPSIAKSAAITTIGKSWGAIGTSGKASFELPLPISSGRGFDPALGLSYDSQAGNGPFGLGWQLTINAITRQTSKGVPRYFEDDVIVGPSGDKWMPERDKEGHIQSRPEDHYNGKPVGEHAVVRYWPRVEGAFDLIELWQPANGQPPFWLVHRADGSLHIYGKSEASRRADPQDEQRVGVWLLLESMNAHGEHIVFEYKAEDPLDDQPHDYRAQRYLRRVCYGNFSASEHLYAWTVDNPDALDWHFHLVFDYGERTVEWDKKPVYGEPFPQPDDDIGEWLTRRDPFFSYGYGFELSTRRLCQQVLMFHHFPDELGPNPALVKRLLLEYQPQPLFYSQLCAAHYQAYDASGATEHMPPMEFDYSPFEVNTQSTPFFPFEHMPGIQDGQHHQCIDLYGEGVPGFLCQYDQSWYYREPLRGLNHPDEITYGPWQALPTIPVADSSKPVKQSLSDLTGDGRFDWIFAQPAFSGFYALNPDRSWSPFSTFSAFPLEFFNALAQFGDLTGNGLSSLALIGPKSVRLYANLREDGFAPGQDVPHEPDDDSLPLFSNSRSELVFLGHMLGSDLPDLCRIRHDEIKCWPNLGHGRFGKGFVMGALPFEYGQFDAARVRIADLDGSGAPALIYLHSDHFDIYLNRGGNRLEQTPILVTWPEGVRYDTLSQVNFADLQGLGCASLILTVPHPSPRHWRYDFVGVRPYALVATNNNMGCSGTVRYRSSAQEWLDEKQQWPDANNPLPCYLPFPVQVVSQQSQLDEITGNCLKQFFHYFNGFYDSRDREFRGFGLLHQTDSETSPEEGETGFTAPLLTRTWFHTGRQVDLPREGYFDGDNDAHPLGKTLISHFHEKDGIDELINPTDEDTLHEIARSLSGSVLRVEVFAAQDDLKTRVPYSVEQSRYLVRELRPMAPHHPHAIVLPLLVEKISYQYERHADDPLCRNEITLQWDRFGTPVRALTVSYARRKNERDEPPFTDPDEAQWWRDAHDEAQQRYYLSESRAEFIHLDELQGWRLGLPWRQRLNVLELPKGSLPTGLKPEEVSYEYLSPSHTWDEWKALRLLSQLSRQSYLSADGNQLPDGSAHIRALAGPLDLAALDETALTAYDTLPPPFDIRAELKKIGFLPMKLFLDDDEEEDAQENLWSALNGFSRYADLSGFYKLVQFNATESHGVTTISYDAYHVLTETVKLPDGCTTRAEYDYHALQPKRVIDANENVQEALYEPSGQPLAISFFGTENGADIGFDPLDKHQRPEDASPGEAIRNPIAALQRAASVLRKDLLSWMGTLPDTARQPPDRLAQWIAQGYILPSLHIRASARSRLARLKARTAAEQALLELIRSTPREPVHSLVLTADDYPDADTGQQIQMLLTCVDGFGRTLQTKQLVEPGMAWVVNAQGELELDPQTGEPLERHADPRWRVSERVEYNNKGLAVRVYRPYFASAWRYINDASFRRFGYHDQQFYDPLGRPVKVISAKGYESRETYHPWCQTREDFNDTYEPEPDRRQGRNTP
ncbi:SpvB/TcaC N-terminal domain-containing protein [Pseudomonas sp. 6D_7.1_Bac1]|uniref:SpvB/TcaC N-terminal domain-containing protein n=1 Tax=Pseudomonas sp. 6D_7.1_Bac1 TaxID=2971615 RepID=UPI0021CAB0DD|nr:SpvB/TcaC N-terminal domain-containing protein [Pseudomonas sp. 6D_7.1_Bac1]MCU1751282.1 toxin [Pseudomonas sp. 6D_7.1_Bac1]